MEAKHLKSRTHAPASLIQPPQTPESQQQPVVITQAARRGQKSLYAGLFWKLGVPIAILLGVFTIMDQVGQGIEDMYSIGTVSKQAGDTDTEFNDQANSIMAIDDGSKKGNANGRSLPAALTTPSPKCTPNVPADGTNFDYNQPAVRCNAPGTTTLSEPTADFSTAKTIVFVMSARQNFEQRAVIRETWAKDHAVYFVVGGLPASELKTPAVQDRLVQEQVTHQDLMDSIHPESYRSLPHKLKFSYQWIVTRWPDVQWLVKVDDDTVARIDTLESVVLDMLNPAQLIVVGEIVVGDKVHKTGKWAELLYTKARTYPYWPRGSCGHAVSRAVAEFVSQKAAAGELILYQGEDTSLGIWLHEASLKKEIKVRWFESEYFTNTADCHSLQWLVIGHQISPAQMKACYDQADEWTDEYMRDVSKNLWHTKTHAQNVRRRQGR
jgi:hypothetical protein